MRRPRKTWSLVLLCAGLLLLAGSGLFTFCNSAYNCPAYKDTLFSAWFPYTEGQLVTWVNGSGGTDTLRIGVVHLSEAQSGKSSKPMPCEATAEVISSYTTYDARLAIMDRQSEELTVSFDLDFDRFRLLGSGLSDTGVMVGAGFNRSEQLYNTLLGNRTYPRLQCCYFTDTNSITTTQPYKVFLAPGYGLAGYELYPSHERWYLP